MKFPFQLMQHILWRLSTFKFQPVHYAAFELNMFFFKQINSTMSLCIEEFSLMCQNVLQICHLSASFK
jgi:hypothetical protein